MKQGFADVPLIVESAQVFETHHVAMLIAAGASAVVPYLAEEFAETEEPGGFENSRRHLWRSAQSSRTHGHLHARQLSQQPAL